MSKRKYSAIYYSDDGDDADGNLTQDEGMSTGNQLKKLKGAASDSEIEYCIIVELSHDDYEPIQMETLREWSAEDENIMDPSSLLPSDWKYELKSEYLHPIIDKAISSEMCDARYEQEYDRLHDKLYPGTTLRVVSISF